MFHLIQHIQDDDKGEVLNLSSISNDVSSTPPNGSKAPEDRAYQREVFTFKEVSIYYIEQIFHYNQLIYRRLN